MPAHSVVLAPRCSTVAKSCETHHDNLSFRFCCAAMKWVPNERVWYQGLPEADLWKLQYALNKCLMEDPFECKQTSDASVVEAGL